MKDNYWEIGYNTDYKIGDRVEIRQPQCVLARVTGCVDSCRGKQGTIVGIDRKHGDEKYDIIIKGHEKCRYRGRFYRLAIRPLPPRQIMKKCKEMLF